VTGGTTTQPTLKVSISGSNLTISFAGVPNATYAIQSSSNLKDWTTVTTITADATGAATYTAPISTTAPKLFYRSKAQ
jgi:hypothetical protein